MPKLDASQLLKRLTIGYLLALSVVACLVLLGWFAQQGLLATQAENATILNISGRQRMLSQRIALFAQLAATQPTFAQREAAREELRQALELISVSHKALREGDAILGISPGLTPEIQRFYEVQLGGPLSRYLALARGLLATEDVELTAEHPALLHLSVDGPGPILALLQRAVELHEAKAKEDVANHLSLGLLILVALISTLLLEARLVFQPLVASLQESLQALVRQEVLERALWETEETKVQLAEAIDAVPVGFVAWDRDDRLLLSNALFQRMHPELAAIMAPGIALDDVLKEADRLGLTLVGGDDPGAALRAQLGALRVDSPGAEGQNGLGQWCVVHRRVTGSGRVVCTWTDISQRKAYEAQMEHLALTDSLTELANREQFIRALRALLEGEQAPTRPFAVVMMDLNRFKQVNDTWGHPVGDALLKQVAQRLRGSLRRPDIVARFGGDEFAVLMPRVGDREAATRVTKRLIQALCEPFNVDGRTLCIGSSAGIALWPEHGDAAEELIRRADVALYDAKATAGDSLRFYSLEMDQRTLELNRLALEVMGAIRQGELALHYQPIVSTEGRPLHLEALLRWHHPELGLLTPNRFLPAIVSRPEMGSVGRMVIREACATLARWGAAGHAPIGIAVNLSAEEFSNPEILQEIETQLERHRLSPSLLKVELTEATVKEMSPDLIERMRRLRDLGIDLSLDDFGTGYSSLNWLQRLPISSVKIDRSFVRGLPDDRGSMAIVDAVLSLAHRMDLQVIAAGVETLTQEAHLIAAGCHGLQGWLYERALPEAEILSWLSAQAAPETRLLGARDKVA